MAESAISISAVVPPLSNTSAAFWFLSRLKNASFLYSLFLLKLNICVYKKGVSWTNDTPFYFLLILSEYLIHNYGNGTIARYIAGGSETVHRNIEGYHKRLHISIET